MTIEVKPANDFDDMATMFAPKNPESSVCWCLSWRLSSKDAEIAKEMTGLALTLGRDQVALEYARHSVKLSPNDRDASVALVKTS